METPYTTHLSDADYLHVYEPAEDSFLLLDALEAELPALRSDLPKCGGVAVVVEIGPGSGVIIAALARTLGTRAACFAVDINRQACRCTRETAQRHGASVEVICGDLLAAWRPHSIDVLLFNPPYVVTPDEEVGPAAAAAAASPGDADGPANALIARAWAGGAAGRLVTDRFLGQLDGWLTPEGRAYLVLIKENDPDGIALELAGMGFAGRVIAERRIRGEHLFVMKIVRDAERKI